MDYEQAFDTVHLHSMVRYLADCRIDNRYINILKHVYTNVNAVIRIAKVYKFSKYSGVCDKGTSSSRKLFTNLLEYIFELSNIENRGMNYNGDNSQIIS